MSGQSCYSSRRNNGPPQHWARASSAVAISVGCDLRHATTWTSMSWIVPHRRRPAGRPEAEGIDSYNM
jgi:hypothetical protein